MGNGGITFDEVYGLLKNAVLLGDTITYGELADKIQTRKFMAFTPALHKILGDISIIEAAEGRGMLSVMVINKWKKRPGDGFYDLAKQIYRRSIQSKKGFFLAEKEKVIGHWKK